VGRAKPGSIGNDPLLSHALPSYHPNIPDGCPPTDARPMRGVIYRSLRGAKPEAIDFQSHAERNVSSVGPECQKWGLSVWLSEEDVKHARSVMAFFRRKHIACGQVTPLHGVIKRTPSGNQPNHHTYWRDHTIDFVPLFRVVMPPVPASG